MAKVRYEIGVITGCLLIGFGAWLIYAPAGVIVWGLGLVWFSLIAARAEAGKPE